MEVISAKTIGGKPSNIGLVFPNHNFEEIKKIYEDFHDTTYDRHIYFMEHFYDKNPANNEELEKLLADLDEHNKKTYLSDPRFFEVFPADKYAPKEYGSAIDFDNGFNNNKKIIDSIVEQFLSYLWKREIPVAQHMKVTMDDQTAYKTNLIGQYIREQEE